MARVVKQKINEIQIYKKFVTLIHMHRNSTKKLSVLTNILALSLYVILTTRVAK